MGLFIHSNLESILLHKRLTELERTSEISTGLLVLKQMLDQGQKPANRFDTLATLERLLPFIPDHQREYVLDQIVRPLLTSESDEGTLSSELPSQIIEAVNNAAIEGTPSDFEVEYQMMISNRDTNLINESTLLQYKQRKQQESQAREEKIEQKREMQREQAREKLVDRLEKHWAKAKIETAPVNRQANLLRQFLLFHRSNIVQEHPLIQKAKERLKQLESN